MGRGSGYDQASGRLRSAPGALDDPASGLGRALACAEDQNDPDLTRRVMALAAAGPASGELDREWRHVRTASAARLRALGLEAEAHEVEAQTLIDLSDPGALERYRAADGPDDDRMPIAFAGPPGLVVLGRDPGAAEVRGYLFAHELAHMVSRLHQPRDGENSCWLLAEPFNDLRAIQLMPYHPGPWRAVIDSCLEVAYGLSAAAGVSPRDALAQSDLELEARLASGLGLRPDEWRTQVTDPFETQIDALNARSERLPDEQVTTELFMAGMHPRIQELIRRDGPGFRHMLLAR